MVHTIKRNASKSEIAKIWEELKQYRVRKKTSREKLKKISGILKLEEDPLKLQKKWRDEWE